MEDCIIRKLLRDNVKSLTSHTANKIVLALAASKRHNFSIVHPSFHNWRQKYKIILIYQNILAKKLQKSAFFNDFVIWTT